jgi:hypothetical protein
VVQDIQHTHHQIINKNKYLSENYCAATIALWRNQ